jgi:hypothetical protein
VEQVTRPRFLVHWSCGTLPPAHGSGAATGSAESPRITRSNPLRSLATASRVSAAEATRIPSINAESTAHGCRVTNMPRRCGCGSFEGTETKTGCATFDGDHQPRSSAAVRSDARLQDRSAGILSHAARTGRGTAFASALTGWIRGMALPSGQGRRSRQKDADADAESSASGHLCGESFCRAGRLWTEGQTKVLAADNLDGIERAVFQHSSA